MARFLMTFFRQDSAPGLVLMLTTALALLWVNSPLGDLYGLLLTGGVRHWVDDGLMSLFFLLVSLEIKREMSHGQLADPAQLALPSFAALGGMIVPALIFVAFNRHAPETLRGWAIPSATDIAFSLGVLSLLGARAPASLKVFLTALAILDDLGAIIIIALFYSSELSAPALGLAGMAVLTLAALNRFGGPTWLFLAVGVFLWLCLLQSGVHATLAGVVVGLLLPTDQGEALEHKLQPWVNFAILPLFALANAGLRLDHFNLGTLADPLLLGIVVALFIGKQAGIFGSSWLVIRFSSARLPDGAGWGALYGTSVLCGIGFTMSLFIGGLAFPDAANTEEVRLGVLLGSLLSGLWGTATLWLVGRHSSRA